MVFFKKYLRLVIFILGSYLMIGCSLTNKSPKENEQKGNEEKKGVWIESEYETYPEGITEISAKWYNKIDIDIMYGDNLILEKKVDGKWKKEKLKDGVIEGFSLLSAMDVEENTSNWGRYSLMEYTNGLKSGEYRIETTFTAMSRWDRSEDSLPYGSEHPVYIYFNVGDKKIKRKMTQLDPTKIEYINEEYEFSLYLPKEWEGFKVFTKKKSGDRKWDKLFQKIDKEYIVMNIRHPKWKLWKPYQDISFVIIRQAQWDKNIKNIVPEDYEYVPESLGLFEYYCNNSFICLINPAAYDSTLKGYNEVMKLLNPEES